MKIAAAQIACTLGDIGANLRTMREFAGRAKNERAELIVFPEASDTGYSMPIIRAHAKPWSEGAVPALQEMAKELSLTIVAGVSERVDDTIYNSQLSIDQQRKPVDSYRKTHLFVLEPNDERNCYIPGEQFIRV